MSINPYDLELNEIVDVFRHDSPYPIRMRVTSLPDDWEAEDPMPTLVGIVVEVWRDADIPAEYLPERGDVERVPLRQLHDVRSCEEVVA